MLSPEFARNTLGREPVQPVNLEATGARTLGAQLDLFGVAADADPTGTTITMPSVIATLAIVLAKE